MERFKGIKTDWELHTRSDTHYVCWIFSEGKYISQVHGRVVNDDKHVTDEEMIANAKLMVASPELLDACIKMMRVINNLKEHRYPSELDPVCGNMQKAIIKALG